MASDGDSRYAPPGANVADVADPQAVVLATRWRRLFGVFLDGVVMMIPGMLLGLLLGAVGSAWIGDQLKPDPGHPFQPRVFTTLLGAALFVLINGFLLVDRGQTVGKVALGMRIVRRDGSRVSALRILGLRYGVGFVFGMIPVAHVLYPLADCLLIFRSSRRCLHDEIADTIVVRA